MTGGVYDLESRGAALRRRVRLPGKYIVLGGMGVAAAAAALVGALRAGGPQSAEPAASVVATESRQLALREFLLDLAPDRDGRTAYLKLRAVVAFQDGDPAAAERAAVSRAAIEERIGFLLRGLTPEDFEGDDGLGRVKAEMLRRVNLVIAPEVAQDVLIIGLVIQ
jgi:flagellar FliL protein